MASNDHDTTNCDNYLLLRPDDGGIFDLFRLLFMPNVDKSKFVECPREVEATDLQRRWLIFVSILSQKVLLHLRKPMAWTGSVLEIWLNLLSSNGNFARLLLNLLQGKVVVPDNASATFASIVGCLDKRVALDNNLINNYGYQRCLELSVMATKLSYENKAFVETTVRDKWKMDFLGFYNFWNNYQELFSTQAFMFQDKQIEPELIMVAFRGTHPFNADQWRTDIDISWYELPGVGKVHGGFMKALGLQRNQGWPKEIGESAMKHQLAYYTIREKLKELLKQNEKAKFVITGHSLGGALAILFPLILILHGEDWMLRKLQGVYTFGQPRVGDEKVGKFMKEKLINVYGARYVRFVYCNDMVPRLPYDNSTFMFKHFGTCIYYNSCYEGKMVAEEPNKNYFSATRALPKILNAAWELVRGFLLPRIKGREYAENWFLKLFRTCGLVVPGLPAHMPPDYINSIRLGTKMEDPIEKDSKLD
ncbi:hypothetical protein Syun_015313 [Stephania yunnanensis]|uniref:Fungal lipase-type domain-containing protein n=1 Tax=Stephania yunnanensis TaxID=152371 RepID=A0AAP0P989_9MAGN